jgi:arsenate reductase
MAVRVMDEIGIDLSGHVSESVDAYRADVLDYVITLCDGTRELSPSLRAREMVIHRPFDDPAAAPEETLEDTFRRVRDEIADWIDRLFLLAPAD